MPRVTVVAEHPDGTWLAVEVQHLDDAGARYVSAIWRVDCSTGEAAPLLQDACAYRAPRFRSDGALGVLSNRPAEGDPGTAPERDARSQLWLLDGSTPRCLTDEPLGVSGFRFAQEADRMVVIAPVLPGVPHDAQRATADDRKKNGPSALHYRSGPVRHWDHWIAEAAPHVIAYDGSGQHRRDLTPAADREYRETTWDLSRDGRRIAIVSARPNRLRLDDGVLLVIDVDTGEARAVVDEPLVVASSPRWSPDGRQILHRRIVWSETEPLRDRAYVTDPADGSTRAIAATWPRWPTPVGWSPDGSRAVVSADDAGHHRVFTVDLATDAVTPLTPEPGSHTAVRCTAHGLVGVRHGFQHAPDVFRAPWSGAGCTIPQRLSGTDPDALAALATLDHRTVAGAHGDPVPYFVLTPPGPGPHPVVMWIHGGPISAWNDAWHWRWNANVLLSAGFAIVLPNPRGSTGFGDAFVHGIWGNRYGAECYQDVIAVADAVAADERLDGERMAAMGGSFGGYMVNWIGGNTDRFRCLVTHASLYDFPRFYAVTDHPAFWTLKMQTTPFSDRAAFNRYSPHTRVTEWTTPTLVIHGEKDYRVPIGEGLALFEALQANGVDSELLVFPDENHWILQPRNIVAWYERVLAFLARYLES